jgi:exodeoxyribonuclease-3
MISVTTWNVNGLRAVLNRGGLSPVLSMHPDIIMLQEIKARPDQIHPDHKAFWQDYQAFWNPAKRPGYSGVANFITHKSISDDWPGVQSGLGNDDFDQEGRVILVRYPDFTLINAYFPSGQRGYARVNYKLEFYAELLKLCDRMHSAGENIIIGGDFNTAHQPMDLRYPKENQKTSGFLPEERAWVDRYLEHNFVDVFRHLYPDRIQYTWWTYRLNARQRGIGWRLDYFLVSETLLPQVKDVIIHDDITGSDHCPVSLQLDLNFPE